MYHCLLTFNHLISAFFFDFLLFSHVRKHVSIQLCSPSCVPEGVTDFLRATLSDSRAIQPAHPLASSQRKRGGKRTVWHSSLHLLFLSAPPFQKKRLFLSGIPSKPYSKSGLWIANLGLELQKVDEGKMGSGDSTCRIKTSQGCYTWKGK